MVGTITMSRINELVRLQETDFAIDKERGAIAEAESRQGETDELVEARARVEQLDVALRDARSTQKDIDLEADGLRAKIAPQEEKLYGGTIKNPKELSDLQADVDQMKRHLASAEDRDLEAIAAVEAAQSALEDATSARASLQEGWDAEQARLADVNKGAAAEPATLEPIRSEQASGVDPELLAKYDHIRLVHQGRGIAKLDRNLCLGCRISLPVSAVNRARAGNTLVQCPNCERILYT